MYAIRSYYAGDLQPVVAFLNGLFSSPSIVTFIIIALSVAEIIAGFFLITELFTIV